MNVYNLQTANGNAAPNQFMIEIQGYKIFKSYNTIIQIRDIEKNHSYVNSTYWDSSQTTLRYFKTFNNTSLSKSKLDRLMKESPDYFTLMDHDQLTELYYSLTA